MAQIVIPVDIPEVPLILAALTDVQDQLALIRGDISRMATQAQIDAIGGNITAAVGQINTALEGIRQDIADLRDQANVDVGPLEARVAEVTAAAQALTDLDVENPPAPPA